MALLFMTDEEINILKQEAEKIADYTRLMINHEAGKLPVNFPYKSKFILEEIIKILQTKV